MVGTMLSVSLRWLADWGSLWQTELILLGCSQNGSIVAEGHLVGILRAVVQELALSHLVDEEPKEDADKNAFVEGVLNHVEGLVVDAVNFLHALQVVLHGGGVGDSPQTQVVHVAKHGPVVLERDLHACLLCLNPLVLERLHPNVVLVANCLAQVSPS